MSGSEIALLSVFVSTIIASALLLSVIVVKAVHRRRMRSFERRYAAYLRLLAQQIAVKNPRRRLEIGVVTDPAFLDALIDLRQTVKGPEVEKLDGLVDELDLVAHQERLLHRRWPPTKRFRAAVALAEMGDDSSADTLIGALDDRHPEIRVQAARGLARMGHRPAIDHILQRLGSETPWVRARFGDTLIRFGNAATELLVRYLRAGAALADPEGAVEAIRILGSAGDPEAGPALLDTLLHATHPEVRLAATAALGRVGGPTAAPVVLAAFDTEGWMLRTRAAHALGELGDPIALPRLEQALSDSDWWVRRNAAAALAKLPGGITLLYASLASKDAFARDAAAEALAAVGALAESRRRAEAGLARADDLRLLAWVGTT